MQTVFEQFYRLGSLARGRFTKVAGQLRWPLGDSTIRTYNIPVLNVAPVFPQMNGDAVGAPQLSQNGQLNRVGLHGAACLTHRGDVIEIDAQARHDLSADGPIASLTVIPVRAHLVASTVAVVFPGLHFPAAAAPLIPPPEQGIGPSPHQLGRGLHAHVLQHPQIQGTQLVQPLPLRQKGIIGIHQEGVIKLLHQLPAQGTQAGEIHHKAVLIQVGGGKPQDKRAAIAMDKATVALVAPLAVAAGEAHESFAAGVDGTTHGQAVGRGHGWVPPVGDNQRRFNGP